MRTIKKFIGFILGVVLIIGGTLCPVYANENSIQPLWDNTSSITHSMSFDDTTGTVTVKIIGHSDVTSIKGTVKVYKGTGLFKSKVDEWKVDTTSSYYYLSEDFTAVSGKTYTYIIDVDVTADGNVEPIYLEDTAKCS